MAVLSFVMQIPIPWKTVFIWSTTHEAARLAGGFSWSGIFNIVYLRLGHEPLARYVNPLARYVKFRIAHAPGMPGTFSRHRGLAIPTCIMARTWRTCRDACLWGKNVPGIPGACTTRNFMYLVRCTFINCYLAYLFVDVSTHPCLNVSGGLAKLLLMLGYGSVILHHTVCLYVINYAWPKTKPGITDHHLPRKSDRNSGQHNYRSELD